MVIISDNKKRSKEEIDAAREKIKLLVKENARELKEKGVKVTMKDILKREQEIRAEYNKEHYGIEPDAD